MDITISIDRQVFESAEALAKRQGTSLNQIVRELLTVWATKPAPNPALQELEELWAKEQTSASGWTWNRDELHDRPLLS